MPFKTKEQKAEYNKKYYANKTKKELEKNKPSKTPVYSKDDYCSQCNEYFVRGYISKHLQTKKHKQRVAELIQQQ